MKKLSSMSDEIFFFKKLFSKSLLLVWNQMYLIPPKIADFMKSIPYSPKSAYTYRFPYLRLCIL